MIRCERDMVREGAEEARRHWHSVIINHVNQETWWEKRDTCEKQRFRVAES